MAITDKTRKVLWGRSGNRCAICRLPLVVEQTEFDAHSVVGDECHIHSGAPQGPRHDASLDASKIDDVDNLLLLCRVHHKMVDDQIETYSADLLRTIKRNHEHWVNAKFEEQDPSTPIQLVRLKTEKPEYLSPIESGDELLNMISGCHGNYFYHSTDLSDAEVELVGQFAQNVKDWADLVSALEPIEKLRAVKALSDDMTELSQAGFRIFGACEKQQLRGGISSSKDFFVFHLSIARENDPSIVPCSDKHQSKDL